MSEMKTAFARISRNSLRSDLFGLRITGDRQAPMGNISRLADPSMTNDHRFCFWICL